MHCFQVMVIMYLMSLEREILSKKIKKLFSPKLFKLNGEKKKIKNIEVRYINPQLVTPFLVGDGSVMKNNP